MRDSIDVPTVLAGVGVVAVGAFVVGAAGLAAQYAGLWAAVTVGAFLVAAVAMALLYAVGEMENDDRRNGGRR